MVGARGNGETRGLKLQWNYRSLVAITVVADCCVDYCGREPAAKGKLLKVSEHC